MKIYLTEDYNAMSRKVANILSAQVIFNPNCTLGLATGSTPIGTYKQLIEWFNKGDLSFSNVKSINLDEYVGLKETHDQSYRYFMDEHFFNHINIDKSNTNVPNGLAENPLDECKRYDNLIHDLGGIDMQLLGIGHNGHIGFNEPDVAFEIGTHVVDLAQKTVEANARFFNNDLEKVPKQAITMGIKNIMHARKIVIAVSGEDKADIINQAFTGKVMPEIQASILQMHPDVTIVGDKAALNKLIKSGIKIEN